MIYTSSLVSESKYPGLGQLCFACVCNPKKKTVTCRIFSDWWTGGRATSGEPCWIWRSGDRASWKILVIKPTRYTKFLIYFWIKTLHVSDSSSAHHQEIFTVHTAMVYVIQLASRISTDIHPDPARRLSANLYDICHCCVYSEKLLMMNRGTVRNT